MKITMYELLRLINGGKAPKKINMRIEYLNIMKKLKIIIITMAKVYLNINLKHIYHF